MEIKICIVGLGYVGLPLAIEFDKYFSVIGFDVSENRVNQLRANIDYSNEVEESKLSNCAINFTNDPGLIKDANVIIVCVPTPVDSVKNPNLSFLESASEIVGKNLSRGSIVVYESTVYPGCTEEVCIPILEKVSGLKCGENFKVGYSPERINPGDKEHTIDKVIKIVAGIDDDATEKLADIYSKVVKIGVHKAPNIKTAEAAKVIENIQRDLNIALMNELTVIFDKLGINISDVLDAASTKWNWHNYRPGLVGGHCIPIDPYYLTYKAKEIGYHPEVILAGRRINDNMHNFVVEKIIKKLNEKNKIIQGSKILIMGLAFKPNVKDHRNSRIKNLISELKNYNINVLACDPLLDNDVVKREFGLENSRFEDVINDVDGIILAVKHKEFELLDFDSDLLLYDISKFSN